MNPLIGTTHPYLLLKEEEWPPFASALAIAVPSRHRVHYGKVLKKKQEPVLIGNGKGLLYLAHMHGDTLLLVEQMGQLPQPRPAYHIINAYIKPGPMEDVVRHGTELGVMSIRFVVSDYSVVHEARLDRLQKIAESAAMQSRNPFLPKLEFSERWENYIHPDMAMFWGEWRNATECGPLKQNAENYYFINGPEGGWSPREKETLKNYAALSFGETVLRSETAALAGIVVLKQLTTQKS